MVNRAFLIKLVAYLVLGVFLLVFLLGLVATLQLSWIGSEKLAIEGNTLDWINNGVENDIFIWISTAISGLVGGVAAAGFGQLTTKAPQDTPGLSDLEKQLRNWLTMVYATVFIVAGAIALIRWGITLFTNVWAPEVVRNLSGVWVGLLLPILSQFFGIDSPQSDQLNPPGGSGQSNPPG